MLHHFQFRLEHFPLQRFGPRWHLHALACVMSAASDDELANIINAAQGLEAHDLDDGLGAVLEAARRAIPKEQYKQRGTLLMSHARQILSLQRKSRPSPIAPHVQERINRFHADYAVREEDRIVVEERRPAKQKGRGNYRHWLPDAILRCCWGLRPRARALAKRRRLRAKQAPRPTAPSAASARNFAQFYRAGHGHVHDVRQAVAQQYMDIVKAKLEQLPAADHMILEVSLDETEMPVHLRASNEIAHVMVIHGRLTTCAGGEARPVTLDLVMPTAVLENTAAHSLLAALTSRLPIQLEALRAKCNQRLTLVLCSDSGPSCLKLARHLQFLPAVCRMHQHCLAMVSILKLGGLLSSLFSLCLLFKRRRVQTMIRRQLWEHIRRNVRVVYELPAEQERTHVRSVLGLMKDVVEMRTAGSTAETGRAKAWRRLERLFARLNYDGPELYHYCPYGCHQSLDEVCKDFHECICKLFLEHPPSVIAENKWTKLWPPLVHFAAFLGIGSQLLQGASAGLRNLAADLDLGEVREDDLLGMDDRLTYLRKEQTRVLKASRFFNAESIREKLVASSLAMKCSLHVMGAFFKSARRYEAGQPRSILSLIHPNKSPAAACLQQYIRVLRDDTDPHWLPLAGGGGGWSPRLYHMASVPALMEMGNIYRRFIVAMDCWPWRLGLLLDDSLGDAAQQALAQELLDAHPCCLDDFTLKFRQESGFVVQDVLSAPRLRRLREIFEHVPLTNVGAENRFASAHTRHATSHGNAVGTETLACEHVLAESKMVLDSGLARLP